VSATLDDLTRHANAATRDVLTRIATPTRNASRILANPAEKLTPGRCSCCGRRRRRTPSKLPVTPGGISNAIVRLTLDIAQRSRDLKPIWNQRRRILAEHTIVRRKMRLSRIVNRADPAVRGELRVVIREVVRRYRFDEDVGLLLQRILVLVHGERSNANMEPVPSGMLRSPSFGNP